MRVVICLAVLLAGTSASIALAQDGSASFEPAPIRSGPNLPPVPRGNFGYWLNSNSYPLDALRNGWQGKVVAVLKVNRWGVVADCLVQESSGYKSLDDAACAALANRARFEPATDSKGSPTEGIYIFPVNWILPDDDQAGKTNDPAILRAGYPRPPVPLRYWSAVHRSDYPDADFSARHRGTTMVDLVVGKDGSVSACTVRRSSGFPTLDAATCQIIKQRGLFHPALDQAGQPIAGTYIDGLNWNPERVAPGLAGTNATPPASLPVSPWQPTLDVSMPASARMQFVLTGEGDLRDCQVEGDAGRPALREIYKLCDQEAITPQTRYQPLRAGDGTVRNVLVTVETTVKVSDAPASVAGP